MAFTDVMFLFIFFPITTLLYYISGKKLKNILLLIFSLLFYSFGDSNAFSLLVITIVVNYILGILLGKEHKILKNIALILTLLWNVGFLFYFKYLSTILGFWHPDGNFEQIILPIGISFFTFRCISYCVDVYWGISKTQYNPINLALYISFFPQLLMGPITKYRDFEPSFTDKRLNLDNATDGVKRIILGLAKKLIIADRIGLMVDEVFALNSTDKSVVLAWFGVLAFLIQLYYDFSGYSDIAIGLGKLLGFETPENFNYPYISKGIIEFWNKWHITLGEWFREYVFTPLFRFFQSKNIKFNYCNYLSLFFVWLLVGIWHGSGLKFAVYGLYYFVFILFERIFENVNKTRKKQNLSVFKIPSFISHIYFILAIFIGQLMFKSETLASFWHYFNDLFALNGKL